MRETTLERVTQEELDIMLDSYKASVDDKATKTVFDIDWPDLSFKNLDGLNFFGRYLSELDFEGSSMVGARFQCADLSLSYLQGCNLSDADFGDANLVGANLTDSVFSFGTGFEGCFGNGKQVITIQIRGVPVVYTSEIIDISCGGVFSIKEFQNLHKEDVASWHLLTKYLGGVEQEFLDIVRRIMEFSPADKIEYCV